MTKLGATLCVGALLGCTSMPRPPLTVLPARAALPEVRDEDWPMFRDDLERSGFAEGTTVGPQVAVLWHIQSFNTTEYGAVKGSPSVVGDVLYCGTDTGRFLAVRISDGEVLWQIQFDKTTHGVHGSPAIVGDLVYIGAYDGTLYAFERKTGLLVWRHKLGFQVGSSPAVVPRWGVVFSTHERGPEGGGYVAAFDARTGKELWQQPTEAHPHSSVAVDVQRRRLFVGDNHGIVYAMSSDNGHELWQRQIDSEDGKADIKSTPMVIPENKLVIVAAWSGKVYALDEDGGEVRWEYLTGGRLMGSPAYLPSSSASSASPGASHGTVFVGSPLGVLHAIDADTGVARWTSRVNARIYSSPAVSGDGRAVVFGGSDGRVYAVRADTGAPMWDFRIGGLVSGSPTLVGNRIYITSQKGGLWALQTHE